MSRTYRKTRKPVAFCNKCNKPLYGRYKNHYENCSCEPETVTMKVRKWKYVKTGERRYISVLDQYFYSRERIEDGWREVTYKLPQSTYLRYDLELLDGNYQFPNGYKGRKEAQTQLNRQFRAKSKQVLRNRNKDWDEMVFPVNRNGVNWEIY